MKLDNIEILIQRDYPNGRFVHSIKEKSCYVKENIKSYLKTSNVLYLFVANEYFNELNELLHSCYSIKNIEELRECTDVDKVIKYDEP